ncbi:GDNF-inducible zinc finger protein 1-like isoform X1 [Vespa crabro]|uniref:GDNF-inducible zinc finger protein 1-like isoform X1 n=2 Tax=Vespa crabro TaxID=7445 RepID=UPI001F02375E|nr:GDNF-inducible zinc finger protein 1-like isoform X1 [Vespa crabro]
MPGEQFSLIWNSFSRNLSSSLYTLLIDEQLVDVTLIAEGKILRAHKLILSVCSTYFNRLFKENSYKHPIVILKDVNYHDLSAMLQFIYQGEVNIKQEDIGNFLKVAEILQIKGLTTERDEKKDKILDNNIQEMDCYFDIKTDRENHLTSIEDIYQCEKLTESLKCKLVQKENTVLPSDSVMKGFNIMERNISNEIPYTTKLVSHTDYSPQRTLFIETYKNIDTQTTKEPFDCTSDINHTKKIQYKSSNYINDMDVKAMYKSQMLNKVFCNIENIHKSDSKSDMQLKSADQSLGLTNMVIEEHKNLTYDAANGDKKHRYIKANSSSTLSLETTQRLVSEIRPTFCMEKGKLMRVYSCSWCLRNFTRRENLKLHIRYIHGPLESLTCKLCGNKYKNSNSLRVHSYLYHNAKRDKHNKSLVNNSN